MTRLTYVGHSTVLIEAQGVRLLTDPVLRERVGPLRSQAIDPEAIHRQVDAVLISHLHLDHLDLPSLRTFGKDVRLIVPRGAARFLRWLGFRQVEEISQCQQTKIGATTVTATPAEHPGIRTRLGPVIEALGYIINGTHRIYFAGDTDLFPELATLDPDLDVALLPVWGWGPRAVTGHLDPFRAAQALGMLRPRLAIPIHWGTFYPLGIGWTQPRFLSDPPRTFVGYAVELAPQVPVRILEPGQSIELNAALLGKESDKPALKGREEHDTKG
jgi:L-ascorbate metabolism protein UlaG (beta-lactamase superfamily)